MTDQKQSLNEGEVSMPRNIKNYCYCSKLIHNPTKASHETINKVSKINKFNKVNPPPFPSPIWPLSHPLYTPSPLQFDPYKLKARQFSLYIGIEGVNLR